MGERSSNIINRKKDIDCSLIKHEEKYRDLVENSPDIINRVDKNFCHIYVNKAAADLIGIPADDFVGKTPLETGLIKDDYKDWKDAVSNVFKTKKSVKKEFNYYGEKGVRNFESSMVPEFGDDKTVNSVLITSREITNRKIFEENLKDSNEQLAAVVNNSYDLMTIYDFKENKILWSNKRWEEFLGWSPEKIKDPLEPCHPDDRYKLMNALKYISQGKVKKVKDVEYRYKTSKGDYKYFTSNNLILKIGGKDVLFTDAHDITETKKYEEKLKKSEESYKELFNNALLGIDIHNADGSIYVVNKNAEKVFGLSLNELKKKKFSFWKGKLFNQDGTEMKTEQFPISISAKTKKPSEGNIIGLKMKKEKPIRWFLHSARPILTEEGEIDKIVTSFFEITKRIEYENRLKESQDRYERIVNNSPDLITEIDDKGKILSANPAMVKSLGFKKNELIGKSIFNLISEDIAKKRAKLGLEALEKNKIINSEDYRDGRYFYNTFIPSKDLKGNRILQVIAKDITQQKIKEREIRKSFLKYDIEEGSCYLVVEKSLNKSLIAFKELLKFGYDGYVFSRLNKKEIKKNIKSDFNYYFLSALESNGFLKSKKIIQEIIKINKPCLFLIDRFDYIIQKIGFKKSLNLIQKLNETAYLRNHIIIISIDPKIVSDKKIYQLSKETKNLEPKQKIRINEEQMETLKFIYENNMNDIKPNYSDIEDFLKVSKPTVRNKIRQLRNLGYLTESLIGRKKILEITEKTRNIFL